MTTKKNKTVFVCNSCGYESSKWNGKCPSCGEWNSFVEEVRTTDKKSSTTSTTSFSLNEPAPITEIEYDNADRMDTGLVELNRVLGSGLVHGSVVLLGGDPGIGKSTLLLQISNILAQEDSPVLYATGEESASQIKIRANRLGSLNKNLYILSETNIANVLDKSTKLSPSVLIVDSIQTMVSDDISSAAGSVSQIREITGLITKYAKENNVSVFIVGHVTKDGAIAGPKILEHLVDAVLYFEGDKYESYRMLRTVKNRYGSTNEIGVFEMKDNGFREVPNPSMLFLSEEISSEKPGSCITCVMEGTRPLIAEIQALTSESSFGNSRRMANGIDYNRMILLSAVLEKNGFRSISANDIYINVVGGLKIDERCADAACVASILSSLLEKPIPEKTVIIGEISLSGDMRSISNIDQRVNECIRMGFKQIIIPFYNNITLKNVPEDIKILKCKNVRSLASMLFPLKSN